MAPPADDHLAPGPHPDELAVVQVFDADGARAFEQDARDEAPRLDPQIRARPGRSQVGHRGAPAAAAVRRHVHRAEAFLPVAVHVVGRRVAGLPAGFDERAIERIAHLARGDVERTAAAVIVVGALQSRFRALEVGQAVRVGPVREALRGGPAVVVERVAADVDHAVDRRRAAEHAAARAGHAASVHVRLGLRHVGPVVGGRRRAGRRTPTACG